MNLLVSRDDERAIKPSPARQRATEAQRAKIADGMRAYVDGVRKARLTRRKAARSDVTHRGAYQTHYRPNPRKREAATAVHVRARRLAMLRRLGEVALRAGYAQPGAVVHGRVIAAMGGDVAGVMAVLDGEWEHVHD